MKQIFFSGGMAKVEDVSLPEKVEGWVIVKTHYSFISSGTERQTLLNQSKSLLARFTEKAGENLGKIVQLIKNNGLRSAMYQIKGAAHKALECGYASAGQVIWAHPSSGFSEGDFVACAGAGFALHAEYVAVPKNLTVKIQDKTKLKEASSCAVAAVAMQGFRQADCKLGEIVIVFGLGLIGLLTVQIAKAAGCKVIGIDLEQSRLDAAKALNCNRVFIAGDPELKTAVDFFSSGHGADAVLICASSNGNLLNPALNLIRRKGKVVVVGDCGLEFTRQNFYEKEASILASCSYGPGRYQDGFEKQGLDYPIEFVRWTEKRNLELCLQMIEAGSIKIAPLVTTEFSFDNAAKAFQAVKEKNVLGALLCYANMENATDFSTQQLLPAVPAGDVPLLFAGKRGKFNVAFVGTGGFAKTKLIPELLATGQAKLECLVDNSSVNLLNACEQFSVKKKYSQIEYALADTDVDVVIIATPHSSHASLAIQALEAGKAVFVEKPPAVNLAQLALLENFLDKNPQAFYAIDFNRSSSSYFEKIHQAVKSRICPLMIDYRVNAGFLSPNHWIYRPENNGRIIGEACHMIEFFLALVGSDVQNINVTALASEGTVARDNFVASLKFQDGSQATLFYTSLGNVAQEKERIEIFWEGRSIVLTDFIKLQGFGLSYGFDKTSYSPEKGHRQALTKFFHDLRQGDAVALRRAARRGIEATKICIKIHELVMLGGGTANLSPSAEKSVSNSAA